MSKALVVIDVQNCFLPGGSLPVGNNKADNDKIFVRSIYDFITSTTFDDVYLTQDMHHPENTSMRNMHEEEIQENEKKLKDKETYPNYKPKHINIPGGLKLRLGEYNLSNTKRRWGAALGVDLTAQVMWPRHCIIPKNDKYYPQDYTGPKGVNESDGKYGSDLAFELNEFKNGKPSSVTSPVYTVYKGFDANKDSYSAIADAEGNDTPFIAKIDGVSQFPERKRFLEQLKEKNPKDIYICGIATDFCVYQTAMDLLDFYVFENEKSPRDCKIHFIHDLTRGVVPGSKNPKELEELVTQFLGTLGVPAEDVSKYFVVEMANKVRNNLKLANTAAMGVSGLSNIQVNMEGGRRRSKTRKSHKKGCNCKSCWPKMKGGKRKGTRKPAGHKKNCKCVVCRR